MLGYIPPLLSLFMFMFRVYSRGFTWGLYGVYRVYRGFIWGL